MKRTNIIIFVIIVLIVLAIFGYAVWSGNEESGNNQNTSITNEVNNQNEESTTNEMQTNEVEQNNVNAVDSNTVNTQAGNSSSSVNYVGEWFISEEAYRNAEEIDNILDRREDNLITDEEFENYMSSDINNSIVELDVDRYTESQIRFDFKLTSPAPTQREADLDDIIVNLDRNVGTFSYTDNWGNSGNGTITLKDNQIELRLETTSAAQGALWGVEGVYTFSYKRVD